MKTFSLPQYTLTVVFLHKIAFKTHCVYRLGHLPGIRDWSVLFPFQKHLPHPHCNFIVIGTKEKKTMVCEIMMKLCRVVVKILANTNPSIPWSSSACTPQLIDQYAPGLSSSMGRVALWYSTKTQSIKDVYIPTTKESANIQWFWKEQS